MTTPSLLRSPYKDGNTGSGCNRQSRSSSKLFRARAASAMAFAVSDELLGTFVPIAVYWIYSGIYVLLGDLEKYRLHTKAEENVKNIVSKSTVVKGVLVQQTFQISVSLLLFAVITPPFRAQMELLCMKCIDQSFAPCMQVISDGSGIAKPQPSFLAIIVQFPVAMFVLDTWQYFMHRYMHINKFLYKHIHSKHHTLVVPYSFGALFNHPLEGLLLDTVGGALAFLLSGMTPRTGIFFFSFATIKTVDDHCGLWLPGNPLHALFSNNSAYHDVHHQLYGSKYNFSQPFFVMWDRILGTYMPYSLEKRKEGGPRTWGAVEEPKTKVEEEEASDHIDGELVLSIEKFQEIQNDIEMVAGIIKKDLWPNPLKYFNSLLLLLSTPNNRGKRTNHAMANHIWWQQEADEEDFDVDEDDELNVLYEAFLKHLTTKDFYDEEEENVESQNSYQLINQTVWCTSRSCLVLFTPRTSCARPTDRFIDAETSRP
ncbi:Fatty acid hydroxylase superfamily [Musa troglodytarum]|uniref:aldehyde oxygenase (deformylating) n=1 Tax=Musa troglodytarum TaxID=320322 RepID=A0A9E7FB00_9LILI|nr:Fatty acid hydroxylase superfamily [Musa troglodytarum]